jgi:hypothetical protein
MRLWNWQFSIWTINWNTYAQPIIELTVLRAKTTKNHRGKSYLAQWDRHQPQELIDVDTSVPGLQLGCLSIDFI